MAGLGRTKGSANALKTNENQRCSLLTPKNLSSKVSQQLRSLKEVALVAIELLRKIKIGRFYFFQNVSKLKSRSEFKTILVANIKFWKTFPI